MDGGGSASLTWELASLLSTRSEERPKSISAAFGADNWSAVVLALWQCHSSSAGELY